ncbi:hypothetical protein AUR64_08005 [Haloprofundus marisrubri]|uniref:SHOCT domain-containing protein n=1 Tax=Haloprofundus marisrubri TaxID=1514971 RepID=A0A0W1RAB9_9EURY|nr:SHOCT domain-containing protein [Haloprofundus marisrubri]KTG10602.1 hypothetical protein AUR64_08005 [Haloprofundus marisrubri]
MANVRSPQPADEEHEDEESPLEQIVAGVVIALIFLVGFGLLAAQFRWFWVVFPVGFAGVLPAAIGLVRWYERTHERDETAREEFSVSQTDDTDRALATLRDRYANGELDESEFERRLEQLLNTETTADARAELRRRESAGADLEREREQARE